MKGKFITFEGCDGSGKTTCSKGVYERLLALGYDVIYTREPGGIDIAEQIRKVILDPNNKTMDDRCEALLYAASRRQHLVEKVLPALEEGKIVICDRFIDSSLAYQGCGRHLGIDNVLKINEFAIEGHMPDVTIFLDVKPEVGLSRLEVRNYKDRLEQEAIQFHKDTSDGYRKVCEMFKNRIRIVDANNDPDTVVNDAMEIIKEVINA